MTNPDLFSTDEAVARLPMPVAARAALLRGRLARWGERLVEWIAPEAAARQVDCELHETRLATPADGAPPALSVIVLAEEGAAAASMVQHLSEQSFVGFEVLVVSAGRPRSAASLRNRHGVTWLRHDRRASPAARLNAAIRRARGTFVCWLDPSLVLDAAYFEKALFALALRGVAVLSARLRLVPDGPSIVTLGVAGLPELAEGNLVGPAAIFRRDAWAAAGGFRDIEIAGRRIGAADAAALSELAAAEASTIERLNAAGFRGGDQLMEWDLWLRIAAQGGEFRSIGGAALVTIRSPQDAGHWLWHRPRHAAPRPLDGKAIMRRLHPATAAAMSASRPATRLYETIDIDFVTRGIAEPDSERKPILVALEFIGKDHLAIKIATHLAAHGFRPIFTSTMPLNGIYPEDEMAPPLRKEDVFALDEFLPPTRWRDFVLHLIASRRIDGVILAASSLFYTSLPYVKRAFPALRVIDIQFNPVSYAKNNRLFARYIDLTICENTQVRDWLLRMGEAPERVTMIPNSIDLEQFKPRPRRADLARRLGLAPGRDFLVGYIGRLSPEKHPDGFLDMAVKLLDNPRIGFVMTGAGSMEAAIRARVEAIGRPDALAYLGFVDDVREYMGSLDVLVIPSILDGLPRAVQEANAMAVPVVASAVGGIPDLIEPGVNGYLCPPGAATEFARAVAGLEADREHHARMKAQCRARVERIGGDARMYERYREAVRGVLTGAGLPPPLSTGERAG